jgi:hypothetical protein
MAANAISELFWKCVIVKVSEIDNLANCTVPDKLVKAKRRYGLDSKHQAHCREHLSLDQLAIRVRAQLHQHLATKKQSNDLKFVAVFSKRFASLRVSFIPQKKRSTILREA